MDFVLNRNCDEHRGGEIIARIRVLFYLIYAERRIWCIKTSYENDGERTINAQSKIKKGDHQKAFFVLDSQACYYTTNCVKII